MNHKHRVAIFILILLSLTLVGLLVYRMNATRLAQLRPATDETELRAETPTPAQETPPTSYKDLVEILSPLPNGVITLSSPMTNLEVKGRARGTWFFEASFPVKLLNTEGDTIATGIAQADGEWMTTEFVAFTATLSFSSTIDQTGVIGALVLQKDNPSGEPEQEDAFIVPVQFAP